MTLYRLAANAAGPIRRLGENGASAGIPDDHAPPTRPGGRVVWLQALEPNRTDALLRFAQRAANQLEDATVLVTVPEDADVTSPDERVITRPHPKDTEADLRPFLDHWKPDLAVFTSGVVGPVTMACCERETIPSIMADARLSPRRQRMWNWAPLASRALFQGFQRILAASAAHADLFEQLGAPSGRVEVTGSLEEGSLALPCNASDLDEMSEITAGRPVWLAASVSQAELPIVLAAHARARRNAHRLLLILTAPPDVTRADIDNAVAKVPDFGPGSHRYRSDLTEPDADTSIYVADTEDEMGLWYRVAPITFLGSTMIQSGAPEDPFGPAALGSAMVHGPHTDALRTRFEPFRVAGASRQVTSAEELASTVADLLAPDRAADLAHKSWQVASRGADVSDRVIAVIDNCLESRTA